jgi:hypothetical protein
MYPYPFFRERILWSGSVLKFPGFGTLAWRLSKNVDKNWFFMYWIRKIYKTISRNNLYEISQNFTRCTGIWKIYITKQFREIIYTKFRERKYNEISLNFAKLNHFRRYFVFRDIKKIIFRDHPTSDTTN